MPLSNELTDTQKHIIREIVEIAEEHDCEDSNMIYVGTHGGSFLMWSPSGPPHISVPNRTALDKLAEEGLLHHTTSRNIKTGRVSYHYTLTQRAKNAIATDFDYPTRMEELRGAKQVQRTLPPLDFSFITDAENRAIIERDYDEVRDCVAVNAHKATIVLCGSIVEALLLERLSVDKQKAVASATSLEIRNRNRDLEYWSLHELVEVAADMGILTTALKNLANELRGYRNVIHPGYESRKGFDPNHVKAGVAVALVGLLVEELS